jgi:hypothetical protein
MTGANIYHTIYMMSSAFLENGKTPHDSKVSDRYQQQM